MSLVNELAEGRIPKLPIRLTLPLALSEADFTGLVFGSLRESLCPDSTNARANSRLAIAKTLPDGFLPILVSRALQRFFADPQITFPLAEIIHTEQKFSWLESIPFQPLTVNISLDKLRWLRKIVQLQISMSFWQGQIEVAQAETKLWWRPKNESASKNAWNNSTIKAEDIVAQAGCSASHKTSVIHDITRADIRNYAKLSGDDNPIHLDDQAAQNQGFPGAIAHGLYLCHLAIESLDQLLEPFLSRGIKPSKIITETRADKTMKIKLHSFATKFVQPFILPGHEDERRRFCLNLIPSMNKKANGQDAGFTSEPNYPQDFILEQDIAALGRMRFTVIAESLGVTLFRNAEVEISLALDSDICNGQRRNG